MSPTAFAFFCAFAFVATAAVLAILAARPSRPIGLGRVALALAVLAAVTAAFVVATAVTPVRMNVFGRLQLLWIDLALVVPAASLLLLALRRRGRAVLPAVVALAWLGTCAIPLSFYAMVVEPNRLVVERATLAAREPLSRPIRIGVLSDIQCSTVGEHEREAVRRIMAERPDLIVIAGDLFQGTPAHFARTRADFIALLRSLSAPGGVFVVRGDVDSDSRTKSHFDDLTEAAGVRVLRDELATVEVEGQKVELYGYDRWTDDRRSLRAYLAIPRARGAARIVLAHRPDPVLDLRPDMDLDLFIAGHTHGGQVVLPFFGPPMTMTAVPRPVGAGGLHEVSGVPIYVSRGIGMERGHAPRVRFLCPPEVAVVTLE